MTGERTIESHDPRDIPILTDAVEHDGREYELYDAKAVHAAVVTESVKLAESLLHQAAKDIEAILFERVLDKLRALLPEVVDRVLREHTLRERALREPALHEPTLHEPTLHEPAPGEPGLRELTLREPAPAEPAPSELAFHEPAIDEPPLVKPPHG